MQITRHVDIPLLPQTHVGLYKLAKADKAAYPRFQFCDKLGVSLDALLDRVQPNYNGVMRGRCALNMN